MARVVEMVAGLLPHMEAEDLKRLRDEIESQLALKDKPLLSRPALRHWTRKVTGVDPTKTGDYAIKGEFVRSSEIEAAPPGTYFVSGGSLSGEVLYTLRKREEKGVSTLVVSKDDIKPIVAELQSAGY